MIPLLHLEEVKEATKDLAELMQKHAFHGNNSTFPEDEQERQKICVRNLDVLETCVKEIKRRIHSLQSKIDALEELYTSKTSKALKKLMVKELEAYEEEISFFRTIDDAKTLVFTLEDYMMECEIELALMKNRRILAPLLKNGNKEQTLVTDQSTKDNAESRSSLSAENSILYAHDKPHRNSLEPTIPNFDDSNCATQIEAKNSPQSNSIEEKVKGRKNSISSDDQYSDKVFSAHNEAPSQVMPPLLTSEVETAISKNADLPAPFSNKKITPTECIPGLNFILSCHIQFTNHITFTEVYPLQPPAFCTRHVGSYFVDLNTVEAICAAHKRCLSISLSSKAQHQGAGKLKRTEEGPDLRTKSHLKKKTYFITETRTFIAEALEDIRCYRLHEGRLAALKKGKEAEVGGRADKVKMTSEE